MTIVYLWALLVIALSLCVLMALGLQPRTTYWLGRLAHDRGAGLGRRVLRRLCASRRTDPQFGHLKLLIS